MSKYYVCQWDWRSGTPKLKRYEWAEELTDAIGVLSTWHEEGIDPGEELTIGTGKSGDDWAPPYTEPCQK